MYLGVNPPPRGMRPSRAQRAMALETQVTTASAHIHIRDIVPQFGSAPHPACACVTVVNNTQYSIQYTVPYCTALVYVYAVSYSKSFLAVACYIFLNLRITI